MSELRLQASRQEAPERSKEKSDTEKSIISVI
jgi:hypothetical protein